MTADGPWSADRELDVEGAACALREALPTLGVQTLRLLGSGWDFDAYEADRRWVFRFPRREAEQARLTKELALLGWLGDVLDVPVPHYAWGALRAPSFPYIFSGYTKLEGIQAARVDPSSVDLEQVGRQIGTQMRVLHDTEVPEALTGVLHRTRHEVSPREARDGKARYIDAFCHAVPPLRGRARRFLTDDSLLVPDQPDDPVLIHDDLHGEHLLLDPEDPVRVVGWLDWGDACFGDPARDFAPLVSWGGDPLLDAMLAGYGRTDSAFRARARFLGICLAFIDWHHWRRTGQADTQVSTERVLDTLLP